MDLELLLQNYKGRMTISWREALFFEWPKNEFVIYVHDTSEPEFSQVMFSKGKSLRRTMIGFQGWKVEDFSNQDHVKECAIKLIADWHDKTCTRVEIR